MSIVLAAFAVILLPAAGLLGYFAFRQYQRGSRLGRPAAHVGKLKPSPCKKVRGKVVAVGPGLKSPLGQKPCVYYRLRIDEERRKWKTTNTGPRGGAVAAFMIGGALGGLLYGAMARQAGDEGITKVIYSWDNVLDETEGDLLVVDDGSGKVEVDLIGAEVVAKDLSRVQADLNHPAPTQLADVVRKRYKIHTVDEAGRVKTMRFVEETLPVGAKVTVVGPVTEGENGALRFQNQGGALLVSERDVGKVGKEAGQWAVGLAAGAVGSGVLGLGLLVAAVVLAL
jgi:hypothetical protein